MSGRHWVDAGKYKEKECEKCREVFQPTGGNTRYCPACKPIAEQELRKRVYANRQARLKNGGKPAAKSERVYLGLQDFTPCKKCHLLEACRVLILAPGVPADEKVFATDDPFCWPSSRHHRVWWEYKVRQCWRRHGIGDWRMRIGDLRAEVEDDLLRVL